MSKLLIQDDIINGMDIYVEYTLDMDPDGRPEFTEVILYDYGLELDAETVIKHEDGGRSVMTTTQHMSLRGYLNTAWMHDKLVEYIKYEEDIER